MAQQNRFKIWKVLPRHIPGNLGNSPLHANYLVRSEKTVTSVNTQSGIDVILAFF